LTGSVKSQNGRAVGILCKFAREREVVNRLYRSCCSTLFLSSLSLNNILFCARENRELRRKKIEGTTASLPNYQNGCKRPVG